MKISWRHPIHAFSSGFGSGLLPKAPGTWGTIVAIPFYFLFSILPAIGYGTLIIFLFFLSVYCSQKTSDALQVKDPKCVVCDEMIGFWVAMAFLPVTVFNVILGFLLFRLLDIIKPWPICYFERLPGGWGIVMDDIIAGLMTQFILRWIMLHPTWMIPSIMH
jgi:phosphatidylglycerophosphatase A